MDVLIGKIIGQYQIISEIGRGGMAIVYKAHHRSLDREVALKVLPPQFAFDNEFVKRFLLEARAAAKLKHPNIVTIYDVGEQDGFYYIVMEWIDGGTLADLIRKAGALPPTRAANILTQIASALDYAHALGFVHRDVKPSNILISANDHATLTDFGIVKAAEGTRVTRTGTMVGTPEYMSPEQIRGQNIDGRADIYALGVVGFEMLAGRVPFTGDTARVLYAQVYEAPPPLRTINARVSPAIEQPIAKALAKDPAQRYMRAGEFATALIAVVSGKIPTRHAAAAPNVSSPPHRATELYNVWVSERPSLFIIGLMSLGVLAFVIVCVMGLALVTNQTNTNFSMTSSAQARSSLTPNSVSANTATPATKSNATPPIIAKMVTTTPVPAASTPTAPPTTMATDTPRAGATERRGNDNAEMVFVPAGEFTMGNNNGDSDEKPERTIYLDSFWMDKYEVTTALYKNCVNANACRPPSRSNSYRRDSYFGNPEFDNYPVIYVSWNDARDYCAWAGKRLPTEAEWEKAARGTDGRIYPWGNGFDAALLNSVDGGQHDTTGVASYPSGASPYGAMDMAGNAWEWVNDWYDQDNSYRVLRGGSWNNTNHRVSATFRSFSPPQNQNDEIGFRCAQ